MNYEREYVIPAIEAVQPWLYLLPAEVARKLKIAASLIQTHGVTCEELCQELGSDHWAICRNTPNNRARYGLCVSRQKYERAERAIAERRAL